MRSLPAVTRRMLEKDIWVVAVLGVLVRGAVCRTSDLQGWLYAFRGICPIPPVAVEAESNIIPLLELRLKRTI